MSGPAPAWLRYLVVGFAACVLGYCLWSGKVGTRSGTVTRARNPGEYWFWVLMLAVFVCVLVVKAVLP